MSRRPNIFQFNELVLFIKAYFENLREEMPEITVRRWAVQMGLSSPKPLIAILQDSRDFRMKDLDFLLKGMDLTATEIRYLETLLMLKKTKDAKEKSTLRFYLDLMKKAQFSLNPVQDKPLREQTVFESNDEDLFSHWVDAALIAALQLKSTRADLNLLRENLLWEKDLAQVDRSLAKLKKQGLLDNEKNTLKYDTITTRSERPHRGAKAYFAQINQLATEAIGLPLGEREFQCFSIPAHVAETPVFKQMIRKFREDITNLSNDDGNIVYQFNLEMFPLTKPMDGPLLEEAPSEVVQTSGSVL
jgi:uncharacterized protein (TIGR02147 family)